MDKLLESLFCIVPLHAPSFTIRRDPYHFAQAVALL
jgi:hypothetical protein